MKLFLGWDVGGWHCDRNKLSRDALVLLGLNGKAPVPIGRPWRGNLRSLFTSQIGDHLIGSMLRLCGFDVEEPYSLTIAIDTPLGWPVAMLDLVCGGPPVPVGPSDGENLYTRRRTELELVRQGHTPLSAVRDMLGSQSTKGIHFLRAAGLEEHSIGIWSGSSGEREITAIETYPAVALSRGRAAELHSGATSLLTSSAGNGQLHDDVRDALACAVVAYLFSECAEEVEDIPTDVPAQEGWIVLPR